MIVPIDGSSLTLGDAARKRHLGRVGSHASTRGLLVLSSMAVSRQGVPLGLLDQRWWARQHPPRGKKRPCCRTPLHLKETHHWVDALKAVEELMATAAPGVTPWFQLDRGADFHSVLALAVERKLLLTVRARHHRQVVTKSGQLRSLYGELKRQRPRGYYELSLPATPQRQARQARIAVRACPVTVKLHVSRYGYQYATMNAVLAEELGRPTDEPIQWMLLTTHPVATWEQVQAVVRAYSQRWRIEEFHRAWKSGVCNVEDTQLQSRDAILKWATLLAAVASRAVRLAYLVRTTPDVPADQEFTPDEIEAAFLLNKRKWDRRRRVLLRDVIALLAELGGFMHKYSGRLPGPKILARGLQRIEPLAQGLKHMREM